MSDVVTVVVHTTCGEAPIVVTAGAPIVVTVARRVVGSMNDCASA